MDLLANENELNRLSGEILSAAVAVHRALGHGFYESVYGDALEIELAERQIPFEREKRMDIVYKGHPLSHYYIADFLCYGKIVVELKAVDSILPVHVSQVINYLKASHMELGLILNFGEMPLKIKRVKL